MVLHIRLWESSTIPEVFFKRAHQDIIILMSSLFFALNTGRNWDWDWEDWEDWE